MTNASEMARSTKSTLRMLFVKPNNEFHVYNNEWENFLGCKDVKFLRWKRKDGQNCLFGPTYCKRGETRLAFMRFPQTAIFLLNVSSQNGIGMMMVVCMDGDVLC